LDKHGRKWLTSLLLDSKGTMSLGKGWKEFVKANSLETGFTLKLIWEETTPVLSLCSPESNSDREQEEISKAIEKHSLFIDPSNRDKISNNDKEENMSWERKKDHLKSRDSTLSSQKQFVTITITPSSDRLVSLSNDSCLVVVSLLYFDMVLINYFALTEIFNSVSQRYSRGRMASTSRGGLLCWEKTV